MALAALAFLSTTSTSPAAPPAGYTQVWADEFNGTALDTGHWYYDHPGYYRSAYNDPSAVSVGGGNLSITVYTDASGKDYSAILDTRFKYQPLYGYIEARISTVNTGGNWSAFWMWVDSYGGTGAAPYHPHTDGTEADIMEHRALDGYQNNISDLVDSALHWDNYNADEKNATNGLRGAGLGTGYHTYGLLWTPTSQTFYIDGVYQYTINDDPQADPPTQPGTPNPTTGPISHISEFLILSTEVLSNSWAGNRPAGGYGSLATSTTKMNVDYVRVYQRNPTAPLAPTDVTAANTSTGTVNLGWELPDNAPYYNIKRSTVPGGPYAVIATNVGVQDQKNNLCYADTTAAPGTTYYYVVSALNGGLEGPNSAEVTNNAAGQPNYVHGGLWSAQGLFTGQPSGAHMLQNVAVAANTNYEAGVWVRGSGGRIRLLAKNSGSPYTALASQLIYPTEEWTYYSVTFNTGALTSVAFYIDDYSDSVATVSVDDTFLGLPGGANLLANPGFETGTFASWNVNPGPVWTPRQAVGMSPNVHSGTESAKGEFSGVPSYTSCLQTKTLAANTDYVAGLWVKGTGTIRLLIRDGLTYENFTSRFIYATEAWTYYTLPFNSGTHTTVNFFFNDSSTIEGTVHVDDAFLGLAVGPNLLTNPGFESGSTGWTIYSGSVWTPGAW
ncbi:Beta-glucanase, GH16 family [Verrucomicrobium sp. GAS474]|nr:Beta-glucanase, GH16 family [Verrucomicrobium sp. GAS474]